MQEHKRSQREKVGDWRECFLKDKKEAEERLARTAVFGLRTGTNQGDDEATGGGSKSNAPNRKYNER